MHDLTNIQTPQANEWIELTARSSVSDIDALCLRLESNGIEVFLPDEYMAATTPFLTNTTNGIRLMVQKKEQTKAYAIMKDWEASLLLVPASCPVCHSQHVVYAQERRNPLFMALLIFIFGIFLVVFQGNWVRLECRNCKHTWKVRKKSIEVSAE